MSNIIVDKNKLNNYRLKITALSPIHIGTGEAYDPTNYVIDKNVFYVFNEVLFYKGLSTLDKNSFNNKLNDYMQIIDFYKTHRESAIGIAHFECEVSAEVQNAYNKQNNKDGTKNKNLLEIQTTFKNPNTHRAIIPGSSIKGMLDTALQIYPRKIKENDIRQNLVVSDAILLSGGVEIGRADRRHKNPDKKSKEGIYQRIEVIRPKSEFIFTIDSKFTLEEIKQALNRFHAQRKDSRYKESQNSFIARIGKNEGKEYVVDDGRNVTNTKGKPVATHFLYSSDTLKDEQFGWINIELISEDEYQKSLDNIQIQEREYFDNLAQKQKILKESIQKAEQEAKTRQQEVKAALEAEAKKIELEKLAKQEVLSKLSPLEREIEMLCEENPSDPKDTVLYQAIESGKFEENKKEALECLCKLMKENGNWKESGKPPKKVKRTQQVLAWLKEIN
jgi:CRISPR-associated protein Csm5